MLEQFRIVKDFYLQVSTIAGESLDAAKLGKVMELFKKYLLIGGLPDTMNSFIADTK